MTNVCAYWRGHFTYQRSGILQPQARISVRAFFVPEQLWESR